MKYVLALFSLYALLFLMPNRALFANDCSSASALSIGNCTTVNLDNTSDFSSNPQYDTDCTIGQGDAWFTWEPGGTNALNYDVNFQITANFSGQFTVYTLYSEAKDINVDPCEYPGGTGYTGLTRHLKSTCDISIGFSPYNYQNFGLDGSGKFYIMVDWVSGSNGGNEQITICPTLLGTCNAPVYDDCSYAVNNLTFSLGNGIDTDYANPGAAPAWSDGFVASTRCSTKERLQADCVGSSAPTPTEDHYGRYWGFPVNSCIYGGNIGDQGILGLAVARCDEYLENTTYYSFEVPQTATDWFLHIGSNGYCLQQPNNVVIMLMSSLNCNNAQASARMECTKAGWTASELMPNIVHTFDGPANTGLSLTAGQRYYIVLDGTRGSQCDIFMLLTRGLVPPVLPVTLKDFTGWNEGPSNMLSWSTTQESQFDHFLIERSDNGQEFFPIGKVNGVGESNSLQQYQFMDWEAPMGAAYYRLSMVDIDGSSMPSNTIEITRENLDFELHEVYPVPFSEELNIRFSTGYDWRLQLRLLDIKGREVMLKDVYPRPGTSIESLDMQNIPSGMYFLQIYQNGLVQTRKVSKY